MDKFYYIPEGLYCLFRRERFERRSSSFLLIQELGVLMNKKLTDYF